MMMRYLIFISLFFSNLSFAGIAVEHALSKEYLVQAGEVYEGNITVVNTGEREEEVNITPYDLQTTISGMDYLPSGQSEHSNYKWLSFSPKKLLLSPGSKGKVNYKLQVPSGTGISGSYWSGLMVAPVKGIESTVKKGENDITLIQRVRYLYTIITHADDDSVAKLEFSNPTLKNGMLSVVAENKGKRAIVPDIWFDAYTQEGKSSGRFEGIKSALFPNQKRSLKVNVSSLEKGVYRGLFAAKDASGQIFGSNLTIEKLED